MEPFRVNADREPDPALLLLGSAVFYPVRCVLAVARASIWVAVPVAAPWVLARALHWPLSWTYAGWEMGAATVFVGAFTLRARREQPATNVDGRLADVFVAGHWPLMVLLAAVYGPWTLLRGLLGSAAGAVKGPVAPREGASLSAPAQGAVDTARSRHSAPSFRAATPRP
jgi:hypothetical protein